MISSKFNQIKKEYLKTEVTSYLKNSGWEDLYQKLDAPANRGFNWLVPVGLAFTFLIVFSTAAVGASQSSKPGDALYSVKLLSDDTYSKVTGNFDPAIDNRVEDIVKLQDESNGKFEEAAKQYQKTIEKAKEENKDSEEDRKQRLRQKLEEQENKLEEISRQNPRFSKRLQQIVDETKKMRGEVKGEKSEEKNEVDNDEIEYENRNRNSSDSEEDRDE